VNNVQLHPWMVRRIELAKTFGNGSITGVNTQGFKVAWAVWAKAEISFPGTGDSAIEKLLPTTVTLEAA
jgi:hypothetical protein